MKDFNSDLMVINENFVCFQACPFLTLHWKSSSRTTFHGVCLSPIALRGAPRLNSCMREELHLGGGYSVYSRCNCEPRHARIDEPNATHAISGERHLAYFWITCDARTLLHMRMTLCCEELRLGSLRDVESQ